MAGVHRHPPPPRPAHRRILTSTRPGDAPYSDIFDLVHEDLTRFWAAVISAGDVDEAVFTALALSDTPGGAERFAPFDKIDAFRTGVLGGLAACGTR